ncbi:hypothetical protein FS749_010604, partial [Ceratobasidium sp. UAMH 11750]
RVRTDWGSPSSGDASTPSPPNPLVLESARKPRHVHERIAPYLSAQSDGVHSQAPRRRFTLWVAESLREKPPRKEAVKSARERRREGEVEGKMEGNGMVKGRKDGDELSAEAGFIYLGSWLKLEQTGLKDH